MAIGIRARPTATCHQMTSSVQAEPLRNLLRLLRLNPMSPAIRNNAAAAVAVKPSESGERARCAAGLFDQKWKCHHHPTSVTTTAPISRYGRTASMEQFYRQRFLA